MAVGSRSSTQRGGTSASTSKSKQPPQKSKQSQVIEFDDDDDDDDDDNADGISVVIPTPPRGRGSSSRPPSARPSSGTGRSNGVQASSSVAASQSQSIPVAAGRARVHDDEEEDEIPASRVHQNGRHGADEEVDQLASQRLGPTPTIQAEEEREEDCIKILLATDNHIGYGERDPVRGKDSIDTFREILQLAVENEVDMLLLAGDLFHENKPTRSSLYRTLALLREHCMGPRAISLEIVSDQGIGLQSGFNFPPINYEDANYNIGLPVFSIHGNHDDPQGAGPDGALCALDILSASGLVNYFGRQELPGEATNDADALNAGIHVKPVLLRKGETKLAMYGIGNIRDERFHAEMRKNRISMFRPKEDQEDWFNLLLIHQNRVPRGPNSSVPETGFGDEVDLIVWGHEHDCRIDPEPVSGKGYYISQPGSSVATSLAMGESIPKHVGLLKIQGKSFQMDKIRLRTVRPFVMDDVVLSDVQETDGVKLENKVQVNKYLKGRVSELIEQANQEWDELYAHDENPPQRMLPLIRLRVEYSGGFEVGNPQRFGQDFTNKVANPRDVVQFFKKKVVARGGKKVTIDEPEGDLLLAHADGDVDEDGEERPKIKVENLVRQYLEAQTLQLLNENGIGSAIEAYVEKDDKHAIETFIQKTLDQQRKTSASADRREQIGDGEDDEEPADTDEEIERGMAATKARLSREHEEKLAKKKGKGKGKAVQEEEEEEEEDNRSDFDKMSVDEMDMDSEDAGRKKGAKGGGAAAKGKGKAKAPLKSVANGRGKKSTLFEDESEEEEEEEEEEPAPKKKTVTSKTSSRSATSASGKKAPPRGQSQLAFAPSKPPRAAAKTASSRAKKQVEASDDSDDPAAASQVIEMDDSDDEPPKQRKSTKRK